MELIPVLDVRRGRAVHARGGARTTYPALRTVLGDGADVPRLARAIGERLGLTRLYVAELDALEGRRPELAAPLVRALAADGLAVWIEAGAADPAAVDALLAAGAERVVVGLETLGALADLAGLVACAGSDRLAFSLDLLDERTVASRMAAPPAPEAAARAALEAGFRTLIVLDLGRVGRGEGPASPAVLAELRRVAGARWYAAGGVRHLRDVEELANRGWHGCLAGTALHEGVLGPHEVERLRASAGA